MQAIRAEPALRAMERADTARNAAGLLDALGVDDPSLRLRIELIIDLAGHLALDLVTRSRPADPAT